MGEKKNAYSVLVGKPEGKQLLGGLNVGGRIILKCISVILYRVVWTGLT
jgi:hypothetical protein